MADKTLSRRKKTASRRVVIAFRMAGIAGQDKLNGIFLHLGTGRRWQLAIYRTKQEFTADVVREELQRGTDGFIAGIPDTDDALAVLAQSTVPTVAVDVVGGGIAGRTENIAIVRNDPALIGQTAASTLLNQGIYKSYGYAGYRTDDSWSKERGTAFRDALDKAGFVGRMFDVEHYKDKLQDVKTIARWLRMLPKPCGILAACDDRAFEILDVCRETGIKVPAEVGIIGVNNDTMLCENSEPRLTSIQPDFIGEGRIAAELLEHMMDGATIPPEKRVVKVGVREVVFRDSTVSAISNAGKLVQRVLNYINKNALKGIGVPDIVKRFKVSRSLLELRFKEMQKESLYEAILRVRLEEVKKRLRHTKDTIGEISAACGWKNPIPLKALFKKRFGMSMRDYRASYIGG